MGLYEIATGYIGCSFERCYAWASSRERAVEMFIERFPQREARHISLVVSATDSEFITKLCDEGVGDRLSPLHIKSER